jgi:hypothetical protein
VGRLIKGHIGIADEEQILFCGLAIGYRDDVPVTISSANGRRSSGSFVSSGLKGSKGHDVNSQPAR